MMPFYKLGIKIDNMIVGIKEWNLYMPWYKPYSYFGIRRMIKKNKFKGKKHFDEFIYAIEHQPYAFRIKKLRQIYNEKIKNQEGKSC